MDAQNGEKIELLNDCFAFLLSDAHNRKNLRDDFYFLSDQVLAKFKMMQGFDPSTFVSGCYLEQASLIWSQCPKQMRDAIMEANSGSKFPDDFFIQPGSVAIIFD